MRTGTSGGFRNQGRDGVGTRGSGGRKSRGRDPVGVLGQSPQKLTTYYENNCQKHRLLLGQSKNNESSYQLYIGLLVVVVVGLLHFYCSTVNFKSQEVLHCISERVNNTNIVLLTRSLS